MEGTSKVFNNDNNSIAKKKMPASSSDVSGSSAASAMSPSKPPLMLSSARIASQQVRKKPYAGMHFEPTEESSTDTSLENDPLNPQPPECNYYEIPIGSSAAINGGATVEETAQRADSAAGDLGVQYEVENINIGVQFKLGHNIDSNMAITKLRRNLSNRVSARKSRMKKLQYVAEMERKVRDLQAEIEALSPQLTICKSQHRQLEMEKNNLTQQVAARTSKAFLTDADIEANKAEVKRLRQLHMNLLQCRLRTYNVLNLESLLIPSAAAPGPLMFDDQQLMMSTNFDFDYRQSDHHHDQYGQQGQFDYQAIPNLNQAYGEDDHNATATTNEVNLYMMRREYDHDDQQQVNNQGHDHQWSNMANFPANGDYCRELLQQAAELKEKNMMIMTPASQLCGPHKNHDQAAVLDVNRPNLGDGDGDDQMKRSNIWP